MFLSCCTAVSRLFRGPAKGMLAGLVLLACPVRAGAQTEVPGAIREVFTEIAGSDLASLTNHPSFPSRPSVEEIRPEFEAPAEWGENYGQRLRALVVPPLTGPYLFWIASDDQGALFLGTNDSPNSRRLIARVNGWTAAREWTKEPGQRSNPVELQAGRRYYLEAIQKEGSGGDNLSVRWQLPGGRFVAPIPGSNLVAFGVGAPVITGQPASASAVEGGVADFTVTLSRYLDTTFAWTLNGNPVPGATNRTLRLGPVRLSDHGSRLQATARNGLGSAVSAPATLSVTPDVTRPRLLGASSPGDPNHVTLLFSEPIQVESGSDPGRYSLDRGAAVLSARVAEDGQTVMLRTTALAPEGEYVVTARGLLDRATTPNALADGAQARFTRGYLPLDVERLTAPVESPGPSTRRGALVISEIHYHPRDRADGRNLEFIEIHNPQPWFEDLGGWRVSGEVEYRFPPNTTIGPRSYIVLAAVPADLEAVHGLSDVVAYEGRLPNDGGAVRLRNEQDAVMWETSYSDEAPWPAAPDGAGHSLVLARASLGERDPGAWTASAELDGSPGRAEGVPDRPLRTVVINEWLARTSAPGATDFIELFNYGTEPMTLDGAVLTDDPAVDRFRVPAGTVLPPRGFVRFDERELGFALDAAGETVFLRHGTSGVVVDAVRFGGQSDGVSFGRHPDGAPWFSALAEPTPGEANAVARERAVVLNEIMYEPPGGETAAEFVELRNLTARPIPLGGWRLDGGIGFEFPPGALLPAAGYVVVARDPVRLRGLHSALGTENSFGPYDGALANAGDRVVLSRPEAIVTTDAAGAVTTRVLRIVVDEVDYRPGGRWPRWAAGGGSSMERVDPRLDGRLPEAWADSDESTRSGWVTVSATGTADLGNGTANSLELLLLGAGECLIDDVRVVRANEGNRVTNGTFQTGLAPWVPQGNQSRSEWRADGGFGDSACLLLRATGRGDTANRVRTPLTASIPSGSQVTLTARARWLRGSPELLLRLHGNWLEAVTNVLAVRALGSPGRGNPSLGRAAAPAISEVRHHPALPASRQDVTVTARIDDPDGLSALLLRYRIDPRPDWVTTNLVHRGAGLYSATIPGQTNGVLAAWYLEATDAGESALATRRFPADAPRREALVRWGEPAAHASFGSYRIWATQATIDAWRRREKLSNDLLDVTVVLGRERVVYNVGARYSGSPYHAPGYDSPTGNFCDYQLTFPEDDVAYGDTDINLVQAGNGCCEGTLLREQMSYAIARKLGIPYNHTRHVHVFLNGLRRAPMLMIDSQQANSDLVKQWWPDAARVGDGDLHKIALWFEFNDAVTSFEPVGASFGNFVSGGRKKLARYRWNWPRRAAQHDIHNYTNLFALHDAMLYTGTGTNYTQRLEPVVDADNWARTVAVEHLIGNPDSFAYGGGQNMFVYKPEGGRWSFLLWDIDFAFQVETPSTSVFTFGGGDLERFLRHPPFFRYYYRALREALDGPLSAAYSTPYLDARYNAFRAAGFAPESPQTIKTFLTGRRTYLAGQLARMRFSPRLITTNSLVTTANPVVLAGVAPPEVGAITVNGLPWSVQWTTVTNWTLRLPLAPGVHSLVLGAVDPRGVPLPDFEVPVTVEFQGTPDPALGVVFINEWLADNRTAERDPADDDFDDWIELHNTGGVPLNLANYVLSDSPTNRTHWRFPGGSIVPARGFLRVWADGETNQTAGVGRLHAGFRLDRDGETIAFFNPAGLLLDRVTFGPQETDVAGGRFPDGAPWAGQLLRPTPGMPNAAARAALAAELTAVADPGAHALQLRWSTVPGFRYRLESAAELGSAGAWTTIQDQVANGSDSTVTVDLAEHDRLFFRVVAGD